jgi:G3E family GTPase
MVLLTRKTFKYRLFDFEKASQSAGWLQELQKKEHTPETEEYVISTFVFRSRRPFHPQRFADWLDIWPEEVVRAKGLVWLATRNDEAILFSQAGPSVVLEPAGKWIAALPEQDKKQTLSDEPELKKMWDPVFGDRIIELVLIGIDLDKEKITHVLETCTLNEEELKGDWTTYPDPLPKWNTLAL